MRLLWTIAVHALSLCIVGPIAFLIVLFLPGPHAGLAAIFRHPRRRLGFSTALADLGCAQGMATTLMLPNSLTRQ